MSYDMQQGDVRRTIQSRIVWLVMVISSSLLLAGWLYQVYQRPYTSIGVCVLVVALLWYTASDDAAAGTAGAVVHRKGEFEVVFWVVFALFSGVVFLMFPDSPILSLISHIKQTVFSWTQDAVNAVDLDTRALPIPASIALVAVITLSTLHFTRLRQREELTHKPDVFTRKLSANLLLTSTEERILSVKEAVRLIDECLRELDHDFLPSSLSRFIRYSKDLLNEAKIIRVFREAGGSVDSQDNSEDEGTDGRSSPHAFYSRRTSKTTAYTREEYSYLVLKCDLALLLYKIKDHSVAAHRRQLIRVLCHDRLNLLTTAAKAMVLHSLQKIKLSSDRPTMERAVFDVLTSCRGNELTELKAIVDSKGNYHSLHKLVFHDIKTATTRKLIANHMLEEARRIADNDFSARDGGADFDDLFQIARSKSMPGLSGLIPPCSTPPILGQNPYVFSDPTLDNATPQRLLIQAKTKIVSDVDDTLECSGGLYPAGIDKRYERHTPYPGVGTFYREIDLCGSGDVVSALPARGWTGDFGNMLGNLIFVSARPHLYKDLSELRSYAKFDSLVKRGILHCTPSLLPGSLIGGREFILRDRLEPLAENKFNNFREYATLYPEYEYVFVGDNGQADVRAVARMMELPFVKIRAAFIHVVQPLSLTYGLPADLSNFCFFTNYIQAAIFAYDRRIISAASLARVTIDAVDQFEVIKNIKNNIVLPNLSSPRGEVSPRTNSESFISSKDGERAKTEQLRLEINKYANEAIDILHRDLISCNEFGWSHEMVSTVRDLLLLLRPIDAPRYIAHGVRASSKYGSGEIDGFSGENGTYSMRLFGKTKPLVTNAKLFSYYMDVKQEEHAGGKWTKLTSLGLFSRRLSNADLLDKSRGSPSGRDSPGSFTSTNLERTSSTNMVH